MERGGGERRGLTKGSPRAGLGWPGLAQYLIPNLKTPSYFPAFLHGVGERGVAWRGIAVRASSTHSATGGGGGRSWEAPRALYMRWSSPLIRYQRHARTKQRKCISNVHIFFDKTYSISNNTKSYRHNYSQDTLKFEISRRKN